MTQDSSTKLSETDWVIHEFTMDKLEEMPEAEIQFRCDNCIVCHEHGVPPWIIIVGEDTTNAGKYSFGLFVCENCVDTDHEEIRKITVVVAQQVIMQNQEG